MFYCEECRIQKNWPESWTKSYGHCEICGKGAECHDRPSSTLPPNPASGGLRRIGNVPEHCMHPQHNPPQHIVLDPGVYEYTCPGCGQSVRFTVTRPTC